MIANLNNLYWLSQTESGWGSGKYYLQTADIDASSTVNWDGGKGFKPLGYGYENSFNASYDGGGYVISGLTINRPDEEKVAFIGFNWGGNAKLQNLGLVDVNITAKATAAGLVAWCSGMEISKCYTTGQVTVTGDSAGGLVCREFSSLIITDC